MDFYSLISMPFLIKSHLTHSFYMPHGLTVDPEDNVWLTDVAMHQVFKFPPRGGDGKPALTLGDAFQPGSGRKFCKPTSVAVLDNGDFFVADGYCNARILKYSRKGELILFWGQNTFSGISYDVAPQNFFAIPHALTLVPELQLLCAADRENGRVQCFLSSNGTFHSQYHNQLIGDRLFSMAYTPAAGEWINLLLVSVFMRCHKNLSTVKHLFKMLHYHSHYHNRASFVQISTLNVFIFRYRWAAGHCQRTNRRVRHPS